MGFPFLELNALSALKGHTALLVDPLADHLTVRICSVMSLNPYFGSLIPVLKEMTKTFCKFLPLIFVLYRKFHSLSRFDCPSQYH
jgi:hypothetical protein